MRVVVVIDNHGPSKPIAVLGSKVRVIPERSCVIPGAEGISEGVIRRDGALADALGAIRPGGSFLEDAVPML